MTALSLSSGCLMAFSVVKLYLSGNSLTRPRHTILMISWSWNCICFPSEIVVSHSFRISFLPAFWVYSGVILRHWYTVRRTRNLSGVYSWYFLPTGRVRRHIDSRWCLCPITFLMSRLPLNRRRGTALCRVAGIVREWYIGSSLQEIPNNLYYGEKNRIFFCNELIMNGAVGILFFYSTKTPLVLFRNIVCQ